MNAKKIKLIELGLKQYAYCIQVQNNLFNKLVVHKCKGYMDTILLCEHYPVYTFGNRQQINIADTSLPASAIQTDRGGLATVHSPGQLIAYFICDVRPSVKTFIHKILKAASMTITDMFSIDTFINTSNADTVGLWTNDRERKLAAIGLRYSQHYSKHGIAINCSNDLSWFKHIEPCGLNSNRISSLSTEMKYLIEPKDIQICFLSHLQTELNFEIVK
ncbi:hypothetical protein GJ496_003655 [Pomphorhynchus laevis]|nr:hypothetical protein GJ496_003655 [Pomphorhynchus laevis]